MNTVFMIFNNHCFNSIVIVDNALILVPSDCQSGLLQSLDLSSLHSLLWQMSLYIFDILFLSP